MSLRLFIGGMRGSQPATGGAFEEFGGDTTSLLLIGTRGDHLVLDAGTGMQAVARQLADLGPGEVTVLFSHYHLDHLAGLMMNPLLYQPDWSFRLVGPTFPDGGVQDAVTRLLARPYWPIPWDHMGASIKYLEFPADNMSVGGLHVRGCPMPHPGGSIAYRIDDDDAGAAVVFATDIEWRDRTAADEANFMTMCREPEPAGMLIIDAHFAEAQKDAFVGWGHSSREDGLAIADAAGIGRVLLGHHAPDADDRTLRAAEQQLQKRRPDAMLARAGRWLTVGG